MPDAGRTGSAGAHHDPILLPSGTSPRPGRYEQAAVAETRPHPRIDAGSRCGGGNECFTAPALSFTLPMLRDVQEIL